MARLGTPLLVLVLLASSLTVASPLSGASAAAPAHDAGQTRAQQASATLGRARDALAGRGGEPTIALRDLALSRSDLPADQRAEAERVLARPTDGSGDPDGYGYRTAEATPVCSDVVCVHYVTSTSDRPDLTDADDSGVPDYVELALATLTHVHDTYVAAGYRAPLGDGALGGDERADVYLKDIGGQGLYGFCTSDAPVDRRHRTAWAYCVLDNDYAEFARHTPIENLQVTAAHEYFHAVQFGYDIGEDPWFMEATATWAEDELYDGVDDNRQYLPYGPLRRPHAPFDGFVGLRPYGTWIFVRYLTEQLPATSGGLPTLVRDAWRRADAAPGAPDDYSLEALRRVLAQRGLTLTEAVTRFASANRMPGRAYAEGRAGRYPAAPLDRTIRLTSSRTHAPRTTVALDHLTSSTVRFVPTRTLRGGTWVLRLRVDMSARFRGVGAAVTVKPVGAAPRVRLVRLDRAGDAMMGARFSRGSTQWVDVTLANAGDDVTCGRGTVYSCSGTSRDDGRVQRLDAHVVRR